MKLREQRWVSWAAWDKRPGVIAYRPDTRWHQRRHDDPGTTLCGRPVPTVDEAFVREAAGHEPKRGLAPCLVCWRWP